MPIKQGSFFEGKATAHSASFDSRSPQPLKRQTAERPSALKAHMAASDDAGEGKKESILAAAKACFAEQGYQAAKMDDIAAKAGVAKGLLYFYFKNKERLFEAVIHAWLDAETERQVPRFNPARSMAERLIILLDFFYGKMEEVLKDSANLGLFRLLVQERAGFPDLGRQWEEAWTLPLRRELETCLEEGARRMEWRPARPDVMASLIMAPVLLPLVSEPALPCDLRPYREEHIRAVLYSLGMNDEAVAEALLVHLNSATGPTRNSAEKAETGSGEAAEPLKIRKPPRGLRRKRPCRPRSIS